MSTALYICDRWELCIYHDCAHRKPHQHVDNCDHEVLCMTARYPGSETPGAPCHCVRIPLLPPHTLQDATS